MIFFITLLTLSFSLYMVFANSKVQYKEIEKTPVLSFEGKINIYPYENRLKTIKNMSEFFYGLIDYNLFVGNINYNFDKNIISIEPLIKDLYYDLKSLVISIDKNYKEEKKDIELYGLKLPYYQIKTKNFYIKLTPKILISDLSKVNNNDLNYLKTRYFIFSKEDYKPYDFNKNFLNGLKDYGGVVLDEKLISKPAVIPLLDTLKGMGITVEKNLKIIRFKGE